MKTNPAIKLLKLSTLIPLVIAIAAALVITPAFAQTPTPHQFVITENPSGDLSVTYDGNANVFTVTNNGGTGGTQHWTITTAAGGEFPFAVFTSELNNSWIEPENSSSFNNVGFVVPGSTPTSASVASDVALAFPGTPNADDTTITIGEDANAVPVMGTFDDDAAPAEAPDTGSTIGLFFLAITPVFGASLVLSRYNSRVRRKAVTLT